MSTTAEPQTNIYEVVIEDDQIEAALEDRQTHKDRAKIAGKAYRDADVIAKNQLEKLELADAPVRIGRFVVSRKETPGRAVSFETAPGSRIRIKPIEDEAA